MAEQSCVVCSLETEDLLLWPPETGMRISVSQDCFIDLWELANPHSSIAESDSKASRPPESRPQTRRLNRRWSPGGAATMSWVGQGGVPRFVPARLVNGSEGGLGMRVRAPVAINQRVRVKFTDGTNLKGNVRYCNRLRRGFQVGLQLENVRLLASSA